MGNFRPGEHVSIFLVINKMCYKSINSPFKEPLIFFTFSLTVNTISFIPGEPIIICLKREPRKILTLFNTVDDLLL